MTTTARHAFLTSSGEPLEIAPDPLEAAIRFGAFTEATGIPAEWVLTSFLSAIPLPIYPAHWPEGRKRWTGVRAETIWHPLMWLPPRVASRYPIVDEDGNSVVEDDDTWAVRTCLALTASGMYDQETGTWADVLGEVGLSVDNPADLGRIEEWLDGGEDEVLDALDTGAHFENPDDPDWAIHSALDRLEGLRLVSWALSAQSLADALVDFAEMAEEPDLPETKAIWTVKLLADMGQAVFASMAEDFPGHEDEAAWWARMADEMKFFDGSTEQILADPQRPRLCGSATRHAVDLPVHRREPGEVRDRTDLPGAERARLPDRPEDLLGVGPSGAVEAGFVGSDDHRGARHPVGTG